MIICHEKELTLSIFEILNNFNCYESDEQWQCCHTDGNIFSHRFENIIILD